MACKPVCRLCDKLRISTAVNVVDGNVVIDLPAGDYVNCNKYCIIVAQSIPTTATIGANVFFTIGGGTVQYPLVSCNCRNVNVCSIRTRTRYSVVVETSATSATFRMLGKPCCAPTNQLTSVDGTAPAAAATTPATT